jgi:hypothetical protein
VELDKMARRAEAAEDALDGSEVRIRILPVAKKFDCSACEAKRDKKNARKSPKNIKINVVCCENL